MKSTIMINYDAGWGNEITLRGDSPLRWDEGTRLALVGPSTWRLDLAMDRPIDFKPLLNDEDWAFGQANYHLEPGVRVTHVYPHFSDEPGTSRVLWEIPYQGKEMTVRLYTPPGYGENAERRYPVIYSLDGQNVFRPDDEGGWGLEKHLNELIEARAMEPVMVVGIDFVKREKELTPWIDWDEFGNPIGGDADKFIPFVLGLKKAIDQNFLTRPDPENTGILGSSLGGLFALYMGRRHPEVFARVAAMSPSFWWGAEEMLKEIKISERHDAQTIYLDAGTGWNVSDKWREQHAADNVEKAKMLLLEDGWVEDFDLKVELFEDNAHNEWFWGQRVGHPLHFLFPWSGR